MTPPAPAPRRNTGVALTVGLAACGGGSGLLPNALGVGVAPFKDLWPGLFVLAGAGSLADYLFLSRRPRSAGWAVAWVGLGGLFFAVTLGYTDLRHILNWLPSFPTILGLAMLTTWLAAGRSSDNLAIAGVALVILGILGFGARFDWLQRILPSAQVVWAVVLLAGGGYLVWRYVAQQRG